MNYKCIEKNINLLIVDDEPDIREVFALTFELDGYNAYTAANAEEAIEIVKRTRINFIISDVYMPQSDGFELLSKLKEYAPEAPAVVLFSGFTNVSREEALRKGAVELLSKPPNLDELIHLIEEYTKD